VPPVDRRDRRIENPILNGPCDAPTRHFRFDAAGITSEIVESRRPSAYFMPIARPKKKRAEVPRDRVDARPDQGDDRGPANRREAEARPVSRPFAPPDHGTIAVEVINHYGDEVLKVFEV